MELFGSAVDDLVIPDEPLLGINDFADPYDNAADYEKVTNTLTLALAPGASLYLCSFYSDFDTRSRPRYGR